VRRGSKIAIVFVTIFVTRATLASGKLCKIKGFVMQIRVYYEDTDVGGVVYHSNYLKFCERARSELFFEREISPILDEGAFVVRSLKADFLKPAVFGDLLNVKTEFVEMKAASLTLSQEIFRGEEKLFAATVRLAFVRDGKPAKIPQNATTVFRTDS